MEENLNFEELLKSNHDPDYIVSCLSLLTPIEKSIVLILHSKGTALNTKQIQNEFILNLLYFLPRWFQSYSVYAEEMDNLLGSKKLSLIPYYDFTPSDLENLHHILVSDINPDRQKQKIETSQKAIISYKKIYQKNNITYPSFEKIESDLKELNSIGIVKKRTKIDKKSKGLWFINPQIDYYLKKTDIDLFGTNKYLRNAELEQKTKNINKN